MHSAFETQSARDHGGNLAEAMSRFGSDPSAWLDLSTGINPNAYPIGNVSSASWTRLPDCDAISNLLVTARRSYEVPEEAKVVAAPGCSALIRIMPRLVHAANVAIPGPTYNEHAAAFASEGWEVTENPRPGVTAAVIVNPNNPDGRRWAQNELQILADALDLLVVDESFMDPTPDGSLIPLSGRDNVVILRSFGKFYGLAGLRLGFAITGPATAARLAETLGPWAISGPALEIGTQALADTAWAGQTRHETAKAADRLVEIASTAGWRPVGGTALFQTFETPDAEAAQMTLASHRIWSRIFPYSATWVRLGLPGTPEEWSRLETAFRACSPAR